MILQNPTCRPVIVPENDGELLEFFGETVLVKVHGRHTLDSCAICEVTTPPGKGSPPHFHDREDELFLMRSGRMRILANGAWTEVRPGDVVFAPKGRVHAYHNHGTEPARFWLIVTPAGFEEFYRDLDREFRGAPGPDPDTLAAICLRHGIHLTDPAAETAK